MIRRTLDAIYDLAGAVAALFLILILVLIVAQVVTRLVGVSFPGGTDYAGYAMAAGSFFALAHTFRRGAHIRVELVLQRLSGGARRGAEIVALVIAAGLGWYFAWYAVKAVRISRLINDISQGQDATPLWIPQLAMAAGTILFAVALTDRLVEVLRGAPVDDPTRRPVEG
jgi:TRAP-type C4-dicarboxylate transport system permease small subunit